MVLALPFQQVNNVTIVGYSAEDDIGLIPWDNSLITRTANTNTLNNALGAMHNSGSFTFVDGSTGPVLMPIVFPGKTYYFLPPIKTSNKIGGAIYGTGGSGYIMLDGQFSSPGLGGMKTRFIGINEGTDDYPVFRIRGNGFEINGIDLYGGQLVDWDSNPQKAIACIQMEGSAANVTGQARIMNCGIYQSTYGIQVINGYYDDDDVFHTDANHGDNTIVDGCVFANIESCFRPECVQAVNWEFRNMIIGGAGNHQPRKIVIFDMVKSGFVTAKRVIVNYAPVVMIRLDDYSPHMCSMDISEVYTDRSPTPTRSGYLTLVSYEGTSYYEVPGTNTWRIRVTGGFGDYNFSRWDTSRLVYANPSSPVAMPLDNIFVDMLNIPTSECFTLVGVGPNYNVDETVANYQSEVRKMSSYYRLDEKSGTSAEDEEIGNVTATTSGTVYWTNDTSTYDNKYKTRTITNASWSSSVATFTSAGHGFEDPTDPSPITQRITVSGVSPSGYNGIYTITAITNDTFSVAMVSDPGGYSSGGTVRHAADGGGLYMASTGAYLNIPESTENSLYTNSTIAFWIYLNSWTNGVVLSRVNTGVNNKSGFRVTSDNHFWISESGQNHLDFASGVGANLFTTKAWFHIAVSLDGGLAYKAYINGALATPAGGDPGTMTGGEWLAMTGLPLRVGAPSNAFYGSGSNSADMVIDDIRLYKRVLSDNAVAQLYAIGNSL